MNIHQDHKRERIGYIELLGEVFVYADDGCIPHFHISTNDNSPDINIKIEMNHYYTHGDLDRKAIGCNCVIFKHKYERVILDYWLSTVDNKKRKRNIQLVSEAWNRLNPHHKIKRKYLNSKRYYDEIYYEGGASLGDIDGVGSVYIYDCEEDEPHFHIVKQGELDCCISIYNNSYVYPYGNDMSKYRRLTEQESIALDNWMSEKCNGIDITRWKDTECYWYACNGSTYCDAINKKSQKPDYTTIR